MPKFRKRPIEIEAFQLTHESRESNVDWPEWMNRAWNMDEPVEGALYCEYGIGDGPLFITTLEGVMRVDFGDWIIQGVKGELYSCKDDIFRLTYEPLDLVYTSGWWASKHSEKTQTTF